MLEDAQSQLSQTESELNRAESSQKYGAATGGIERSDQEDERRNKYTVLEYNF